MLDNLIKIAKLSGKAKQHELAKHPELQEVFRYAYDPYKHYYVKDLPVDGEGVFQIGPSSFDLLDDLNRRTITGGELLHTVANHVRSLNWDDAEVFKRILNKDMRVGMGAKTINKVWPGLIPEFSVQRAKLFEEHRVTYPIYVSPKLDGVRGIYRNGKLYSRNGLEFQGLEHITDYLQTIDHPGYELDGELLIPDLDFETSSGLIRNNSSTPEAVYLVFDMPDPNKVLFDRLELLRYFPWKQDVVQPVECFLVDSEAEIHSYYRTCRNQGFEGIMIKNPSGMYRDSRGYDWMKYKSILDADCAVTGFYEGKGKYVGKLGGITIDFNGKAVDVGGGFSDEDRISIWRNRDTYLGKVAEVRYQEETKYGSMRHPRFVRWRFDKHE